MPGQLSLSQVYLDHIRFLTNDGQSDFHLGYQFISNIIQGTTVEE